MKTIVFNYALEMGGTDRVAVELSSIFSESGMDVTFLTMKKRQKDYFSLNPSVRRSDLGFVADDKVARGAGYLGVRALKAFFKMVFFIIKERPDYIVSNWTSVNCFALLAALPFKTKVVCVEHIHFSQPSKLWQFFRKLTYGRAHRVICLTDDDLADYLKIGAKVEKIYNPLTVEVSSLSRRTGKKFIAVGRLELQKGFDILINSFRLVVDKHPDATLEIYGDGSQHIFLSTLIYELGLEDSVLLRGPTKDISGAYSRSDFFVLSSRFEGFGLVIVEAQAHGLPVAAFDCPRGPAEIIDDRVNGLLAENGSVTDLSMKMIELIENPEMCSEMVSAAFKSNRRSGMSLYVKSGWPKCLVDSMYKVDFSIIMPAYNAEMTLAESIQSVLAQTLDSYELIIVDDCSTDGTRELILSFAALDQRIRPIFLQKNGGVSCARNAAIRCAEGRYIAFLDADDIWLENKLLHQLYAFNQGAEVVYSDFVRFHMDGSEKVVVCPDELDFKKLLNGNCIGNLTAAYDVSKLGRFYQESIGHEDYLMWLEIFRKTVVSKRVPEKLARYRVLNSSVSANKIKAVSWTWNIYRNKVGLGFFSSCYHLVRYIFGAIVKRV